MRTIGPWKPFGPFSPCSPRETTLRASITVSYDLPPSPPFPSSFVARAPSCKKGYATNNGTEPIRSVRENELTRRHWPVRGITVFNNNYFDTPGHGARLSKGDLRHGDCIEAWRFRSSDSKLCFEYSFLGTFHSKEELHKLELFLPLFSHEKKIVK